MMQLWFNSSLRTTVSGVISELRMETTVAYADEKIIAASRPWNRARRDSRSTWG